MNEKELWAIMVPTEMLRKIGDSDKKEIRPITVKYHRIWDEKVRAIAGGLTILTPVKGQWIDDQGDGTLYAERMIPVHVACTREQLEEIIQMTLKYYDQLAVMAYKISNEVIIRER